MYMDISHLTFSPSTLAGLQFGEALTTLTASASSSSFTPPHHPDVVHLALLVEHEIHEHAALYAVLHCLFGVPQIHVDPLGEECGRVARAQEGRLHVALAVGHYVGAVAEPAPALVGLPEIGGRLRSRAPA